MIVLWSAKIIGLFQYLFVAVKLNFNLSQYFLNWFFQVFQSNHLIKSDILIKWVKIIDK